jgi:chloramphenicol-sensitive protein RarD
MNKGIVLILLGYFGWGLFPLYWSLLNHVAAIEVLAHRMFWSAPVLLCVVLLVTAWRVDFMTALRNKKELSYLFVTAMLITINWGVYLVAVNQGRVVEASMGYFLTPLLNVLGGYFIFKEKISFLKQLAIGFAALGVFYYISSAEHFPWLGLVVGVSFAAYTVLRKLITTAAVSGLFIETLMLLPFSLALIIYLSIKQQASFLNDTISTDLWLYLAGIVTVIPLVLFTAGARLLPITTTAILFYITPTLQFLLAIWIFNEVINPHQLLGFLAIWIGLALYSYALIKKV